jgi:LPXTG-motif cell wall-anchored protein
MKQYFITFFAILAATAVVWIGVALNGYRGEAPPYDSKLSDLAGPHIIIDWPGIALLIAGIAGVSLIVWIILRKRKQKSK